MRAVDIIVKKRDGKRLTKEELSFLISGYVNGDIPDYQISAWAMAVFLKGMDSEESAALSEVMLRSGDQFSLPPYEFPYVDKHSTGGVGDKTSLIIAPVLASLGVRVPMMAGRALGHTGGTLDKLEAIPGYSTALSEKDFFTALATERMAIIGQSSTMVPADRLLYALRDVSGTVESIPLITASILSKKVAEGADALVFDVKSGSGAFMKDEASAKALAESLVNTGSAMGKRISALISDMEEPLGYKVGNFLEVEEALDCLEGKGPADLVALNRELAVEMLLLSGKIQNRKEAGEAVDQVLADGSAFESFMRNIERQGGSKAELLSRRGNWRSEFSLDFSAEKSGYIAHIDAYTVGLAAVHLGVGRNKKEDTVDPLAGIEFFAKSGAKVSSGECIARLWAFQSKEKGPVALKAAENLLKKAISIEEKAPAKRPLIIERIKSV